MSEHLVSFHLLSDQIEWNGGGGDIRTGTDGSIPTPSH